jgi:hypothetical protein
VLPKSGDDGAVFASDIRGRFEDPSVFRIGVSPRECVSTVSFKGLDKIESLYLFAVADGKLFQVRKDSSELKVGPSGSTVYLTVFATKDKNFIDRYPGKFRIGSPWPNPFINRVAVDYTVPHRFSANGMIIMEHEKVKIAVYDFRGRIIRNLLETGSAPGNYRIVWDGRSNTGAMAGSGSYLIMVTAGNHTGIRNAVMIK